MDPDETDVGSIRIVIKVTRLSAAQPDQGSVDRVLRHSDIEEREVAGMRPRNQLVDLVLIRRCSPARERGEGGETRGIDAPNARGVAQEV